MNFQDIQEHFSLDLDCSRPESGGVVLPPIQCPLGPEEMAGLRAAIHPLSPSFDNGRDLYESAELHHSSFSNTTEPTHLAFLIGFDHIICIVMTE